MTTTPDAPDEPNSRITDLLAQVAQLSDAQAHALARRWPLAEAPDGDVVLIAVPGRSMDPGQRARIEAAHARAGQAVADRAAELGYDPSTLPRHWLCTLAEVQGVAVALMVRPDDVESDDTIATWYLAMTEVWRQEIGSAHPDDPPPLTDDPFDD